MSLIDEVKDLNDWIKDDDFDSGDVPLEVLEPLLKVLGQFQPGDIRCLKAITGIMQAVTGKETSSDEMEFLHRMMKAATLMEADA